MKQKEGAPCGAFIMIGAIILTFVITALSMLVLFLLENQKKQKTDNSHILRENDGLRRQISDYQQNEQRRRECSAYDKGLYDGRTSDAYYRQCLKKFTSQEQNDIILGGEDGRRRRAENAKS